MEWDGNKGKPQRRKCLEQTSSVQEATGAELGGPGADPAVSSALECCGQFRAPLEQSWSSWHGGCEDDEGTENLLSEKAAGAGGRVEEQRWL